MGLVVSGCGNEVILDQPITMTRPYLINVHTPELQTPELHTPELHTTELHTTELHTTELR